MVCASELQYLVKCSMLSESGPRVATEEIQAIQILEENLIVLVLSSVIAAKCHMGR